MRLREVNIYVPMVDLMTCTLMTVFVLFIAALAEVRPETPPKKPTIETDGIFAVVMEWPADSSDDIDLYVMNPEQDIVFFGNPSVGLMHLERDDLGHKGDTSRTKAGKTVAVERNMERTIIRGIVAGEYVVNAHVFAKRDRGQETPVQITLYRMEGSEEPIAQREFVLTRQGEEHTAFRMTIDDQNVVTDVNELPREIVGPANESDPDALPGVTP